MFGDVLSLKPKFVNFLFSLLAPPQIKEKQKALNVPQHVAVIMDGNRRWAKKRHLPVAMGHWKGAEVITKLVKAASDAGVRVLTLWALSTENLKRSEEEVEGIMRLLKSYLLQQKNYMIAEGVKLDIIGDVRQLPEDVQEIIAQVRQATADCHRIELVLAINYGGRDDIRRAVAAISQDVKLGKIENNAISEQLISSYLDTSKWEDPELLIRTGGEQRLSNFLLWQASYSEMYITDVLWPDFDEQEFLKALAEYRQRERRMGK